jgi:hypothetical protein
VTATRVWIAVGTLAVALAIGCGIPSRVSHTAGVVAQPTPATFKALDEQTLADQPKDTQATFEAAYGEAAAAEWNAGHNRQLLSELDERAMLRVTPNPVLSRAWAGSTTISFDTGGGVVGQVFVSVNEGPEKPFATAIRGSQDADWIWRGSTYEFRLYAGTHREHLLRRVSVTRANDAFSMLWPGPAVVALALLLAGVAAAAAGRRIIGTLLKRAFGVVTTGFLLWLVLTTPPRALDQQPFPDTFEYADAAVHLAAGDGYVTSVHDQRPQPPRYPPGFSLVLVPVARWTGSSVDALLNVTPWLGALYVIAAATTAWLLGGPIAAGLAAALVGSAPFAVESASLLMSDALVAALTCVLAALLQRQSTWSVRATSVLSGGLALMRLSAAVAILALLLAIPAQSRRRVVLLALPGVLALLIYQWATFGSPIAGGYDYWLPQLRMFAVGYAVERPMGDGPTLVGDALNGALLGWLCPCQDEGGPLTQLPNALFYLAVVFGPLWVFAPPLVGVVGLVYAVRHRREPAAAFTLWLLLLTVCILSVYVFQAARLIAAPAVLLAVLAAVALARRLDA